MNANGSSPNEISPHDLMQAAIEAAQRGMQIGQTPFGCAIALGGKIVAASHNTVLRDTDITAHAEVNALRDAGKATCELLLTGAIVATTCEPCPMCAAALHWARVEHVYYGADINDAASAGFNELHLSAADLYRHGKSTTKLKGDVLADECRQLFDEFNAKPDRSTY